MLTSEIIKKKAYDLGASVCGIGKIYDEPCPGMDPLQILPEAKSIIGFGFAIPRMLFETMHRGVQFYTYSTMGVKYPDSEFAEIFLLKMAGLIEDEGYDACLQKPIPNLRIKGDKTTNPEAVDTYELIHATPVAEGKPAPDVIIDFGKAAAACGIGNVGLSGKILSPKHGPYIRYCFIITDAPLETDSSLDTSVCDKCGKCIGACPGKAISEDGLDTWQCSVYYKGAHKSNPFMTDTFLADDPEREAIINGEKRFDAVSAREIYPKLDFLPQTQWGYSACLCTRACDYVCYEHLIGGKNK